MREKRRDFLYFISVILFVVHTGCTPGIRSEKKRSNTAATLAKSYVLLISIDGYRWDYTDRFHPQNLIKFRNEGSSAKYLLPIFPSKTFTNHYSIATGMYADRHGIVSNSFYDPIRNHTFRLAERADREDGTWYGGSPLWVSAEKQGMLTSPDFWPGTDAAIQDLRPSYSHNYDEKATHAVRIQRVLDYLKLPEDKRPHFLTLYFSDVDSAGHIYGPDSKELKEAVLKVDHSLGQLFSSLERVPIKLNIIIVSDHGMQALDEKNVEYLDDYADFSGVTIQGTGPLSLLYVKDKTKIESLYHALKKGKHFKVYKPEETPKSWHFSRSPRVGDLIVSADSPFGVGVRNPPLKFEKGGHGYDVDRTATMRAIFYAKGPHIRNGIRVKPFQNIHIYPFITKILGLKLDTEIDGDPSVLSGIYRE